MSVLRKYRFASVLLIVSLLVILSVSVALADDSGPTLPKPIWGPRLAPPPIPHTSVLNPYFIYNQPRVEQNAEAKEAYSDQDYYYPGAGVSPTVTDVSNGITLHKPLDPVCYNFNSYNDFASRWPAQNGGTDIWTDYYTGWGPFAVDDYLRQAKNTTFSLERTVGPGRNYGNGFSLKIASNQPYAGGWASPLFEVVPGSEVTVIAKYLIYNWTQDLTTNEVVHDWASLGVKADAYSGEAVYVNGYRRGEWATLSQTVTAGDDGVIMVLIQGESTGAVNSNIYFDDIQLVVNGEYRSCE